MIADNSVCLRPSYAESPVSVNHRNRGELSHEAERLAGGWLGYPTSERKRSLGMGGGA